MSIYSEITLADDWRDSVSAHLLEQWQAIGGTQSNADISFTTLSPQYTLPSCDQDVQIHVIRTLEPGRNGVELQCQQPYWSQSFAFELHVYHEVVALRRAVNSGNKINEDDIHLVKTDTGELTQGYFTLIDDVIGNVSKRNLRTGTLLSPDLIEPAILIERGQPITLRLNRPGIYIEMKGLALSAGSAGERIRVQNEQSGKRLYGVIVDSSIVQIQ
ncbi:MAG: flagellar basal body P-ring formation chaperone FlgA [Oleibacter sp.]|nr:flagellar basal body P-ring formation chaperone FlgA [Thalassolituus sp.]